MQAMYAKPKAAAVASKAMAPIPKGKKADKVHAPLTYTNVFESKQVEPAASIGVFSNFNVTMMKSYAEAASPRKKAAPSRSVLTATTAFAPSAPVDDQHDTMMQIFSNRLLKIKVKFLSDLQPLLLRLCVYMYMCMYACSSSWATPLAVLTPAPPGSSFKESVRRADHDGVPCCG